MVQPKQLKETAILQIYLSGFYSLLTLVEFKAMVIDRLNHSSYIQLIFI